MHASKRVTLLAVGLWLVACVLGAFLAPLQVVYTARRNLAGLQRILAAADQGTGDTRIMLVGSSPVQIGLSAKLIEQATGVPSFNLGVSDSAEFFDDYIDTVLRHLRKGDVVVVSNPLWLDLDRRSLQHGCVSRLSYDCLMWRATAFPHFNLTAQLVLKPMLSDALGLKSHEAQDLQGDALGLPPTPVNNAIEPMPPPPAEMVVTDLAQITGLIGKFRERDACPLFALGPVFIQDKERAQWSRNLSDLQNAAYKRGLGRYLLGDAVAQTDRAKFGDSPEHPSVNGGVDWTRRIVDRLLDRSKGPCADLMAADRSGGGG